MIDLSPGLCYNLHEVKLGEAVGICHAKNPAAI